MIEKKDKCGLLMKKRDKKDKRGLFFPMRARYAKPKINLPRPYVLLENKLSFCICILFHMEKSKFLWL